MSEETLNNSAISLAALKAGDRTEFARLVDATSNHIYHLALKILRDPQDAEDVLQESYIKAMRALPEFEGRSSLSTWLYRIAVNEALMLLRKRRFSLVPVEEAFQLGADIVIAVDVQGPIHIRDTPYNAVDIMVRCERISASRLKERNLQKAHAVIKPFSDYTKSWGFEQGLDHIKKGEEATRKQMSNIMEILKKSQKKSWLKKLEEFIAKLEQKG